ncbi:amino acid permease [Kocuria sp. JC486]|uniref:amino acid permease n=1 Tax=Kocuria sp. JC486 TaxID=1970736 RepID=UPI001ADD9A78|nr:amino acid permease [Kocuria sp. JC486]
MSSPASDPRNTTTRSSGPETTEPSGAQSPQISHHLGTSMKARHLVMMSLGSAIGAGLFIGSGGGIAAAGPAVLLSYAIAGLVVILVMRSLGEMVAAAPASGAFSVYAERAMGPAVGFTVGWLWWIQLCLVIAAEATASAQLLVGLWPVFPQWLLALVFMIVFTGINLLGVGKFGEFEFWFSLLKVGAVVAFLIVGLVFLFGGTPADSPGLSNLTEHGGFLPMGLGGVAAGLLVVAFAFGGIEIVAVAAAETADPARNVSRAVRTIVWRILLFYMGSVAIMVIALPWDSEALASSPFVATLDAAGLPGLGAVLGIVIVIALLSSLNANLYGASRMIFSLAERGLAPGVMRRTNSSRVPVPAVLASTAFGFICVGLNYLWAEEILGILLNIVGSTLIVTWLATLVSHLILRRRAHRESTPWPYAAPLFPWTNIVALVVVVAIIGLGLTVPDVRFQIVATSLLVVVLVITGALVSRHQKHRQKHRVR